ncbi:MAG: hypothetical protein AB1638_01540 [Nitrospirota bacterium]
MTIGVNVEQPYPVCHSALDAESRDSLESGKGKTLRQVQGDNGR